MSETWRHIFRVSRGPLLAWAILLALLILTVFLAYVPMGEVKLAVSLTIAAVKTIIIALIFMELLPASGLLRLAAMVGVLWLFFLFFLSFSDYLSR